MQEGTQLLADVLAGLFMILLGTTLFTRSVETTVDRFFDDRNRGLRILGNLSLSLPELVLPLFAFLGPGTGPTAIEAGTGALFGPPAFLLLFLIPLILLRKPSFGPGPCRIILREAPLLSAGLAGALMLLGSGPVLRSLLAGLLVASYVLTIFFFPAGGMTKGEKPVPDNRSAIGSFRFLDVVFLAGGTLLMIGGSHFFLAGIDLLSAHQGPKAFWFSLLLTPLATEAPELLTLLHYLKNRQTSRGFTVLWGSIHFQLTLSIALGLFSSPWNRTRATLEAGGALLTLLLLSGFLAAPGKPSRPASP